MVESILLNMFYSGGFLLDPATNLILLHKRDGKTPHNPNLWAFFGGNSEKGENPMDTFLRELNEELGVEVEKNKIHTLRDYFNPDFNLQRHVFWAEIDSNQKIVVLNEGADAAWVSLNKAFELPLTKRTRDDLAYFKSLSL
jgi:8-oxo-dGTP diphosphatase